MDSAVTQQSVLAVLCQGTKCDPSCPWPAGQDRFSFYNVNCKKLLIAIELQTRTDRVVLPVFSLIFLFFPAANKWLLTSNSSHSTLPY